MLCPHNVVVGSRRERIDAGVDERKAQMVMAVHSESRCTLLSDSTRSSRTSIGKAAAMCRQAAASGRKNTESTCEEIVRLTSAGVIPTFCRMRKRCWSS